MYVDIERNVHFVKNAKIVKIPLTVKIVQTVQIVKIVLDVSIASIAKTYPMLTMFMTSIINN